jgi:subtilisin family serine protease
MLGWPLVFQLCFWFLWKTIRVGAKLGESKVHLVEDHEPLRDTKRRRCSPKSIDDYSFLSGIGGSLIISIEGSETPLWLCDTDDTLCQGAAKRQQDELIAEIQATYEGAKVVSRVYKLVNVVYMQLPGGLNLDLTQIQGLHGVVRAQPQNVYETQQLEQTVDYIGATFAHGTYCATGKGVKVAVLDSGVDYTHEVFGGGGTPRDFLLAYGPRRGDPRNRQRDGLFPTERVSEGFDYIGEFYDRTVPGSTSPDEDPIDGDGHGTAVASAVIAVAPDAQIIALKVCIKSCPQSAVLSALEYALDPNQDGSMLDKVDVINMSFSSPAFSSYFDPMSLAIENTFKLGVLSVISAGNQRNNPYIIGIPSGTANALAVAATGSVFNEAVGVMESYSSRGPSDFNYLKPDLSAPGQMPLAAAGTGSRSTIRVGTSFSAPLVAGAAALLKEKCPNCSPLAIKALLMNNAYRNIRYFDGSDKSAPVTLGGSGELRVDASLEADFWAFSPDAGDVQPSLSLGLVNAAKNVVIHRAITVSSLTNASQTLKLGYSFRDPDDEAKGALRIVANPTVVTLDGCSQNVTFDVEFHVIAAAAPDNVMTSGGKLGSDASQADMIEFDGYILIESIESGKEIGLPFLMLLRKAANVTASNTVLPSASDAGPGTTRVTLKNLGAGTAQIDAYNLLGVSDDSSEAEHGESELPGDLRAVGYRTVPGDKPGCSYLLEFAFTLWERPEHLVPNRLAVLINTGIRSLFLLTDDSRNDETLIFDPASGQLWCTGFVVGHGTNSRNAVVNVCSEDIGLEGNQTSMLEVTFRVGSFLSPSAFTDSAGPFQVSVPDARISAPSLDLGAGSVTDDYMVTDKGAVIPDLSATAGLLMLTNGYRNENRTGAAVAESEAILFLRQGLTTPTERTPDTLRYPDAQDSTGPQCKWLELSCSFPSASPTTTTSPTDTPQPSLVPTATISFSPTTTKEPTRSPAARITERPSCPPLDMPRAEVLTLSPTNSQSSVPSMAPSNSLAPTTVADTSSARALGGFCSCWFALVLLIPPFFFM